MGEGVAGNKGEGGKNFTCEVQIFNHNHKKIQQSTNRCNLQLICTLVITIVCIIQLTHFLDNVYVYNPKTSPLKY